MTHEKHQVHQQELGLEIRSRTRALFGNIEHDSTLFGIRTSTLDVLVITNWHSLALFGSLMTN